MIDDRAGVPAGPIAVADDHTAGIPGPATVLAAAHEYIDFVMVLSSVTAGLTEGQDGAPAGDHQRRDPVPSVSALAGDEELGLIQWDLSYRNFALARRGRHSHSA